MQTQEFAPVLLTGDAHRDSLRRVVTPTALSALQARNKQRATAAIKAMGSQWCCWTPAQGKRHAQRAAIAADLDSVTKMLASVFPTR